MTGIYRLFPGRIEMDNHITEILQQLAQQLNTTVPYLWGILIRQAYWDGIIYIILLGLWNIPGLFALKMHMKLIKKITVKEKDYTFGETKYIDKETTGYYHYEDFGTPIITGYVIAALISLIATGVLIPKIIVCFTNPEYHALKIIFNALSK